MPRVIKCDICGGLYNQSHLSSHKRLSHGKRKTSPHSSKSDPETVRMIVSLYEQLPNKWKKEVLDRLTANDQTKP